MTVLTPYVPDRMLHGGDYNPDQWPADVWSEDLRLMLKAHCNVMTVGVFAWAAIEPEEGVFRFEWLDRVLDLMHANGISAVLATPSAAHPSWLSQRYPEVLRTGSNRVRHEHRVRVNYCLTSPVYRRACAAMAERLAERYGRHPALKLWHVSNEYHDDCHCALCQTAFRDWLQRKYGALDTLNEAWGNAVWSHTYTTWEQICSPQPWPDGEWSIQALSLDWRRFVNDQSVACLLNETEPLRRLSPQIPITTNMHQTCAGMMDWTRFAPHVDVASWDNYPVEWMESGDWRAAAATAFRHDFHRALKQRSFLMMESCPAAPRGKRQKRPGLHRLVALQAIAHGADMAGYFQWRNCRSGIEKFDGAVVDHGGTPDTRVYREVAELGGNLQRLADLAGAMPDTRVAVIFDAENHWATAFGTSARVGERDHVAVCEAHYRPFWKRGISVDVIASTADFAPYRLLIAPNLYMLRPGVAQRLTAFVEAGGTFVTTYWSGYVDENDRAFRGGFPGPLRGLLGIWSEELDGLKDGATNGLRLCDGNSLGLDGTFGVRHFCDVCRVDDADVLATYTDDYYAGSPALTCRRTGRGSAYYLATAAEDAFLDLFYGCLIAPTGIASVWPAPLPEGVTAQARGEGAARTVFLMNCTAQPLDVSTGTARFEDVLGTGVQTGTLRLAPYGVLALKRVNV